MSGSLAEQLFDAVQHRATTRKARLLMVACCRLRAAQFFDPRIEQVLAAAEMCADDPAAEALANELWNSFVTAAAHPPCTRVGTGGDLKRAIAAAWELVREEPNEFDTGERYSSPRAALASAVLMSLRGRPLKVFTGGAGDAVFYCLRAIARGGPLPPSGEATAVGSDRVGARLAGVVRDIFGTTAEGVTIEPAWRTSDVTALARGVYEERAFDRLPLLMDALLDAGCHDALVLDHCRAATPHVRGCWLVDGLLQKS